jgi:hypothetical protein
MEPVTLIITALAAGASAGVFDGMQDSAQTAAKAVYARLHALATRRVTGRHDGERALQQHAIAPQKWSELLAAELKEANAAGDTELVSAAQEFMTLLNEAGVKAGRYNVAISGSRNVQVGDGNTQVNF